MIWHVEHVTHDDETDVTLTVVQDGRSRWMWNAWDGYADFIDDSNSIQPLGYDNDREAREAADSWFRFVYLPKYNTVKPGPSIAYEE
jgi:hypothetical protein